MKISNLFTAALLSAVLFNSCKKEVIEKPVPVPPVPPISISPPPPFGFYVVGYFPNYRTLADVPDQKFKMCNVINYAFFGVNSSGTLTVNNAALVPQVIAKAKAAGAKVMVSINDGAGDGKTNFRAMASTATGRNTFVKDLMAKVKQYGFDGADIDWEYPSTADGSDVTFAALMKELSDSLHRDAKYYLTASLPANMPAASVMAFVQKYLRTPIFSTSWPTMILAPPLRTNTTAIITWPLLV